MAFSYTKLMDIMELPASTIVAASAASAVYINPINTATYIAEIEVHNTNNQSVTVVLYQVPDISNNLGVPSVSSETVKIILDNFETVWIEPKYPYVLMDANDSIFGVASLTGVNIQVRGGLEA
jgi:hypothetical protein